jgi:hypothetical protein
MGNDSSLIMAVCCTEIVRKSITGKISSKDKPVLEATRIGKFLQALFPLKFSHPTVFTFLIVL